MENLVVFLRFDIPIKRGSLKKLKPLLRGGKKDLTKNSKEISIAINEDNKLFTLNPIELHRRLQREFGENLKIKWAFLEYSMIFWRYMEGCVYQLELPCSRKISDTFKHKRVSIEIRVFPLSKNF